MEYYIKSINWILTYKCNLKCHHCDIWENPYKEDFLEVLISRVISSDIVKRSFCFYGDEFDIGMSWWEPFILPNLYDVYGTIDDALPGAIHSVSTNGILTDKILRTLIQLKKDEKGFRKINISLDGSELYHDMQRWIRGSFRKTIRTILEIKRVFPQQLIELKFTITKDNYGQILYFSRLAHWLGVFFSFKPVEDMRNYTNQGTDIITSFQEDEILEIERQVDDNPYIKKQDFYISPNFFLRIPGYLRSGLAKSEKSACTIANDSITIMPDGEVYSCILMDSIGNLFHETLDDIWSSDRIQEQRRKIKEWQCQGCMLMCGSFKTKNIYE